MSFDLAVILGRLRPHLLPLVIGGLGLVLVLFGLGSLFFSNQQEGVVFEGETTEGATSVKEIIVDVSGAVVAPGVYQLKTDGRIQDALIAAGGLSEDADRDWVAKNLNLAAKLIDGGKIYIPEKSITGGTGTTRSASSGQASIAGSTGVSGLININNASLAELDKLAGVGPVTAQKIVDNRPYGQVDELRVKKVVGQKVFDQIKNSISVY